MLPQTDNERAIISLDGAVDLIKKHGHVKLVAGNREIGFCALGAISRSAHENVPTRKYHAGEVAQDALRVVIENGSISNWNDVPSRTKREVLKAMRQASKDLHVRIIS